MGQKVNPVGFRLGVIKTWDSRWFSERSYSNLLHEDLKIKKFLKDKFFHAGISKVEIERAADKAKIGIHAARPGIIIGRKGSEIEKLKSELEKMMTGEVIINILEVRKPEVDAQLVAENVALQLVRRVAFRRAMKRAVTSALRFGAQGIRVICSGRLGGAEMARCEWYREGRVPLHTLRADIDYGFTEAKTTYGIIGVKVFIFHGEVLPEKKKAVQ
ncbi:MAG TPA: 30S ribosomal protein S3 [Syntrophales bacterium]|nr:30S ribosomal protein S3 [Syntrophales bacterium]HOP34761.1 30S ribosomal protein S3 [Syntrophales bacterium]HPQ59919.1 30S ribosomal protein S3 [Syntrophales bacterium]